MKSKVKDVLERLKRLEALSDPAAEARAAGRGDWCRRAGRLLATVAEAAGREGATLAFEERAAVYEYEAKGAPAGGGVPGVPGTALMAGASLIEGEPFMLKG